MTKLEQQYNTLTSGSFNYDIVEHTLTIQSINESNDVNFLPNGWSFDIDLSKLSFFAFRNIAQSDGDNKPIISNEQATNLLIKKFADMKGADEFVDAKGDDAFYERIQDLRNDFIKDIENTYTIIDINGDICNTDALDEEDYGEPFWYDDTLEECVETAYSTITNEN